MSLVKPKEKKPKAKKARPTVEQFVLLDASGNPTSRGSVVHDRIMPSKIKSLHAQARDFFKITKGGRS